MGNNWYYTILYTPKRSTTEILLEILQVAEHRGYSSADPWKGLRQGMHDSGLKEFTFDRLSDAVTFLATEGGLLKLWKGESDISIRLSPPEERVSGDQLNLGANSLREFSIGIDNAYYRFDGDSALSVETATDAYSLFCEICELLDARYGYCTDEYILEYFFYNLSIPIEAIPNRIAGAAHTQERPAFLFWLQYFSKGYAARVPLGALAVRGGKIAEFAKGYVVSLFDWPWEEQRSSKLRTLNKQWVKQSRKRV